MLSILIRREILAHVLSLRFAVTFSLFLILIFSSIYVTANAHNQDKAEYEAQLRASREHVSEVLSEKDEGRMWDRLFWDEGTRHAPPPAPLAWLGHGLSGAWPSSLTTTSDGVHSLDPGMTRNPLLGLLRVPDFVYVVNVVLSLLAILFMFDSVCGEKESGTLRLLLSNSVPRHTVLMAKWIGGYVVLMVPFLIAVGGGLGYAWARGVFQVTPDAVVRVIALIVVAAAYIAVFFNIGIFVSTCTSKPTTALLICLLVWVASIIIIPNMGPVTARILVPSPSRKSIEVAKRAVDQEINIKIQRLTLVSGEVSYGSTVERSNQKLEQERLERKHALDVYFQARQDAQLGLARTLGRISPAACWTYAAVALTGTGVDSYTRFRESRDSLSKRFTEYVDGMVRKAEKTQWKERPKIYEEELPSLRMSYPDTATAFRSALDDFLILMILNVVFFMLGSMFFLRYDVR